MSQMLGSNACPSAGDEISRRFMRGSQAVVGANAGGVVSNRHDAYVTRRTIGMFAYRKQYEPGSVVLAGLRCSVAPAGCARLELRMQPRRDHRNRPAIPVIGGIGDELIIEGQLPGIHR